MVHHFVSIFHFYYYVDSMWPGGGAVQLYICCLALADM